LARVETIPAGTGVSYNHTFRTTRPSVLGLVPLGFADGLPRLLSNRGHMLVRGRRCPIVGRVCMDQTVLDVTDVPGVRVGEPVVVLGCQGEERIGADEIGRHAGTNAYETLCRLGPRVPHDYTGA
jgi:alanine racemase